MTHFRIQLDPTKASVYIDGLDVSDAVQEVHVHKDGPVAVPQVALVLSGEHVELVGSAVVQNVGDSEAASRLIESLDPETIEKAALQRDAGMGQSLTPVILEVVAEMVSGRTSG